MVAIAYLITPVLVLCALLVLLSNWRYNRQINKLFVLMDKSAPRVFSFSQLSGLPRRLINISDWCLKKAQFTPLLSV